nr:DUF1036 domain-containing protein [Caballeronia sp. GAWG1-1]
MFVWTFCNQTNGPITIATAFREGPEYTSFRVQGWITVGTNSCKGYAAVPLGDVFYYAQDAAGKSLTADDARKNPSAKENATEDFCVSPTDFNRISGTGCKDFKDLLPFIHKRVTQKNLYKDAPYKDSYNTNFS